MEMTEDSCNNRETTTADIMHLICQITKIQHIRNVQTCEAAGGFNVVADWCTVESKAGLKSPSFLSHLDT